MLKISFIIPVFNEVKTVKQAIIQIVELDYQEKEIIIVDNGSLDGSVEIIKEFENLPNVKLFLKKKKTLVMEAPSKRLSVLRQEIIFIFSMPI